MCVAAAAVTWGSESHQPALALRWEQNVHEATRPSEQQRTADVLFQGPGPKRMKGRDSEG